MKRNAEVDQNWINYFSVTINFNHITEKDIEIIKNLLIQLSDIASYWIAKAKKSKESKWRWKKESKRQTKIVNKIVQGPIEIALDDLETMRKAANHYRFLSSGWKNKAKKLQAEVERLKANE